jgi:hypothetical protein
LKYRDGKIKYGRNINVKIRYTMKVNTVIGSKTVIVSYAQKSKRPHVLLMRKDDCR